MKYKNLEKIKRQEGAITLYVLLACLFFTFVLSGIYVSNINKMQAQEQNIKQIQDNYAREISRIDEIYQDLALSQIEIEPNGGTYNLQTRNEIINYSDVDKLQNEWDFFTNSNLAGVDFYNPYSVYPETMIEISVSYDNKGGIFSKKKIDVTNMDTIVLKCFMYENASNPSYKNKTTFGLASNNTEVDANWVKSETREFISSEETGHHTGDPRAKYEEFKLDVSDLKGEYYIQLAVTHVSPDAYTAYTGIESIYYTKSNIEDMMIKLSIKNNNKDNIKTMQYAWSNSNSEQPTIWNTFNDNQTISKKIEAGTWYLWTNIETNNGKSYINVSEEFKTNYEIKYDTGGGSMPPKEQTKMPGQEIKLSDQIPVKRGYQFLGWSTSNTESVPTYKVGDTFKEDKSVTLYAVWEKNKVPTLSKVTNTSFQLSEQNWTANDITVKVSSILENNEYILQTKTDHTDWQDTNVQIVNQLTHVYARLKDKNGNVGDYTSYTIDKIDKHAPEITELDSTNDSIRIKASDFYNGNTGSGIVGYAITIDSTRPSQFVNIAVTTEIDTIVTGLNPNTKYYVWIRDYVDNISEYKVIRTKQ